MKVELGQGVLTPAYGRDYKSKAEVERDFLDGKDFVFNHFLGQTYCSIRDCQTGMRIKFRYNKERKVTFITVP